jgi:hypothetical protein
MKKTILLLCIVMASMMANAVSLPTIYVNAGTGSDVTGTGTDILPVKTFSKAILLVGAQTTEIILAPGIYMETFISDLKVACPNLTIKGDNAANTIIDGSGISASNGRILKTTNAAYTGAAAGNNLTIRNLTFRKAGYGTNGLDAGGGAIYYAQSGTAKNNLTLENVVFEDNKVGIATSTAPRNGAALYFTANNLTINNCYFKNNNAGIGTTGISANTCGGAIFILSLATTNQGVFATISNTTFDGNEANQSGGAVEVSNFSYVGGGSTPTVSIKDAGAPNSYVKFTNCTFVNNKVRTNPVLGTDADAVTGTAIHANTQTTASFIYDFTLANCTFANNIGGSTSVAGGIGTAPYESKSTVDFDGTNWATAKFVNNIINTTATANCGSALMVNAATGGTKITGSNNIIESVHANITDASFYTAGANATNVASTLTNNSTASVFAVPYLELATGSSAIDAGVNTFGTPEIVPTLDVRANAIENTTKDLGAFEYVIPVATALNSLSAANAFTVAQSGANFTVNGIADAAYAVYSVNGSQVSTGVIKTGMFNMNANKGIYLLKVNGKVAKFTVQ